MTNLDRPATGPSVDCTINNKTTADPAADGHIQHRVMTYPRPISRFAEGGRRRIVLEGDPLDPEFLARPLGERISGPSGDLV